MPRMNIYVPDELKARMDEAGQSANWSAVAQRAFEVELNQLESIKEVSSMPEVIDRLRASKEKYEHDAVAEARPNGITWARNNAAFNELRQIARINEDMLDGGTGYVCARHVYVATRGEDPFDDDELGCYFLLDEECIRNVPREYILGFIKGATAVWEEVAEQI